MIRISFISPTAIFHQPHYFDTLLLFGLNFPQQSSLRNSLLNCLQRIVREYFCYLEKGKYIAIIANGAVVSEIISVRT